MGKVFEKIIKFGFYLLVFLMPLFWLPFSFETFEFNKQYLLFFFVSIILLVWLAKMILVDKELRFRRTPLDIPALAFLFIAVLSAVFSVDKGASIFGFYGRFSDGLMGLISLGVLYFLLTNNVKPLINADRKPTHSDEYPADEKIGINQPESALISVSGLLKTFMWSIFFVILMSYLSIFGVWQKLTEVGSLPTLPQVMLQKTFNPVSGSLEGLAIFLAIIVVFLTGLLLSRERKQGKLGALCHYLLLISALGLLVLIDFSSAWLVILLSLGILFIFSLAKRIFREDVNRLLLVMVLLAVSAFFLFFNTSSFANLDIFQFPREQVLNQGMSWKVVMNGATENIKSIFFGSGIGTFHYDFARFKPAEFNQNLFWQIRYDRAGNHLSEILATMGFLGLISYLVLIGVFLLISWFLLGGVKGELKEDKGIQLPLLLAFLALMVAQFVYYQNTVLAFSFWFILAMGVISWQKLVKEKTISLKNFPEINLVFSALLVFLSLAVLVSYYFLVRFYLADVNYLKAQLMPLGEERIKILERAVELNPNLATYQIVLARAYWLQILQELAKTQTEQDMTKIQNSVARTIDRARRASQISPNSLAAFETLGIIYRDIQPLATGATQWAINSFQGAIELEPKNPVLYTELGKLYLASDLQKARENFARAKELKPDYLDSQIQDALTYEMEQNLDEAIKRLEEVVKSEPFNVEVKFNLGRLYFNNNRIDDAISQFEDVILLSPNHSNSLYSLGLAYAKKGEKEKAISYFEKVLQLNPANQEVINKIEELR
jgi:tetratricopeptide (TPR) repeat protein